MAGRPFSRRHGHWSGAAFVFHDDILCSFRRSGAPCPGLKKQVGFVLGQAV